MESPHPLDAFTYCPRCGSRKGSSPTVKLFACPDCGFRYFQNAAAAVMAILRRPGGEILLVRRGREPARGLLDLPGGFVDPLETLEAALVREVREEVGIAIARHAYLASFPNRYHYAGVLYYTIDSVFLCDVADPSAAVDRDEVAGCAWLRPEAIDHDEVGFESVRAALRAYAGSARA
ncbi:MAG: NUDIX domain-containing protein [Chthonomonadales bacterium]|nr:NUDIX domain-containing protein [Chthonomonadales bacterium]